MPLPLWRGIPACRMTRTPQDVETRRNRQRVDRPGLPGSPGPAGQGRQAGNIATEADLAVLANFVVNSWEGALTRARAAKIKEPLQRFFDTVFGVVLR